MSFHADQSLSLFIYFLGKVFIIQFLSYINHTLLFLRNPIGKLTIEMITLLHSTNVTNLNHRGLKLDGAIGQGEICNSLKREKFSKSFLSHIGKYKITF